MNKLTTQDFAFLADALKRFRLIHWMFAIFVILPTCIISFPFWLCGLMANIMQAAMLWLANKLPDYNKPTTDASSLNPD